MMLHKRQSAFIATVLLATGLAAPARADDEARLKLDIDTNLLGPEHKPFTLKPMLRTEQRFRTQGLVLLKVFAGLRSDLTSWLKLQGYYAYKDMLLEQHQQVHMLVGDVILHYPLGPVTLSDRSGNEWHSDPGFYRYRNNLEANLDPGLGRLRPWFADEVRFDSDQERMNLNDFQAGVDLLPRQNTKLRLYYDLELNRRSKDGWVLTRVYSAMLQVHL